MTEFTLRYVIMSSAERDTIEAALGSGHELVARLKEQFTDSPEEARYRYAAQAEATDELEVDDNAVVSIGDDGAFVMAWLFIEADEDEDEDEDSSEAAQ
jgi:precorrin-3B methylase